MKKLRMKRGWILQQKKVQHICFFSKTTVKYLQEQNDKGCRIVFIVPRDKYLWKSVVRSQVLRACRRPKYISALEKFCREEWGKVWKILRRIPEMFGSYYLYQVRCYKVPMKFICRPLRLPSLALLFLFCKNVARK